MFVDDMGLYSCDTRRRPSLNLDAGYVSITPDNTYQSSKIIGLHGKKLICTICIVFILILISLINLTFLIWLMHKFDWSVFNKNGSKLFRLNKLNQTVEFFKPITMKEQIYTTNLNHLSQIDLLTNQQINISTDQNSIFIDDDNILLNTNKFYFKNQSKIDFTHLQSYKFNHQIKTRIYLDKLNSQYIHNKHLNLTANQQLIISKMNQAFFFSQHLILEANRNNRRSILRFNNNNNPKRKQTSYHQKILPSNLHFKSDSLYLDLPRLPLLGNNYRSETGIYRLCICNTTFLFLRSFAHQLCPLC